MGSLLSEFQQLYSSANESITWSSVVVYTVILLASWVAYYWLIQPLLSPLRKVPGLPWNPIIGNMPAVMKGQAMESTSEWVEKYGPIVRYYFFFGTERLMVAHPDGLKHIMVTNSKNYIKPPGRMKAIKKFLGNGLVMSDGAEHRAQRKLVNPAFNTQSIKKMIPVFESCGKELTELWHSRYDKLHGDNNYADMEVGPDLLSMSLDAIGQCAFGYKFNALESALGTAGNTNDTSHSFKRIISGVGLSWKMMIPFWDKLPFEDVRRMNADVETIKKTVFKVINQKKAQLEQQDEKLTHDLLDMLLLARDEETGKGLSDLELKDQVMTFLLAGHETTSTGLSWILLQMANHPECQEKVRQEVREILPKDGTPISWDDLDKLQYTHAVVKETLRILPPVPLTLRQSLNDDVICGYFIPAGTIILLCHGVMMRQKDSFEDPLEFNPDRFLNETNDSNPYHFLPFLLGPRMCIGHKFAMAQMKLILALVVREFQLSPDPAYTYKRRQRVTMRPDPDLSLRISRIE